MNISDMIEFVNKISAYPLSQTDTADGISMSELREDTAKEHDLNLEKEVKVAKVEGV